MNDNCLKIQCVQGFVRYSVNSLNDRESFFFFFFPYNPDLLIRTKVTWSLYSLAFFTATFYKKYIRFPRSLTLMQSGHVSLKIVLLIETILIV